MSIRASLATAALWTTLLTGCGYTILEHPRHSPPAAAESPDESGDVSGAAEAAAPPDTQPATAEGIAEIVLPPGHPQLIEPEDWVGRSFLDDIVGADDPLRFENLRSQMIAPATLEHATLILRITIGGPAIVDVWQIRMDEFGWVTAAHWEQGFSGPQLDEAMAAERVEFRLERESEAALRMMMIDLLPKAPTAPQLIRPRRVGSIPPELWPYEEPGLLEVEYRIETPERVAPEDWPGGKLSAPLDLVQILLGTWHSVPPAELQRDVWILAQDRPLLLNLALLVEGIVLAWEVEGQAAERLDLPLWVGR